MRLRLERPTVDGMFVVRRLQVLRIRQGTPLYMCVIGMMKAYDTVDRTFLWDILKRCGAPPVMLPITHQFRDGMRARCTAMASSWSGLTPSKASVRATSYQRCYSTYSRHCFTSLWRSFVLIAISCGTWCELGNGKRGRW